MIIPVNSFLFILLAIEGGLIMITTLALTVPRSAEVRRWLGLSLLAVTFVWSIVLGSLLALQRYQSLQGG